MGVRKWQEEGWIWQSIEIGKPYGGGRIRRTGQILTDEIYPCGFCKGEGEKPRGTKCSVCRGKGEVSLEPPTVICAFCKGGGEERPRTNVTCTVCRGKGVVSIQEPIEICSHCRGTGAEPTNKLPCIVCRGKGVITTKPEIQEPQHFLPYVSAKRK